MEASRKVEKKWAAFVPNKTKQNIWSKEVMVHWTHCYITRVLHQRPLIHWANLTLALRSQSTQRNNSFVLSNVESGPSQTRSSLHGEIYIHVAADSVTLLRENRFLKDLSPLLLHILTVTTKQQPVGLSPTQQSQIVHFLEASLETDFKTRSVPIRVQMTNITAIKSTCTACTERVLV